jgi:hypothetical protein
MEVFEQYVLYGLTYASLERTSGLPVRTLERHVQTLFTEDPPPLTIPQGKTNEAFLLIDGLWFGRKQVLMVYRQSKAKPIIHAAFHSKEYGSLIAKDLRIITQAGYRFTGVVSDGGTGIRKAVWEVFNRVPHQICLAHVHRQATAALGKKPKDERVIQLKALADHLWLIESQEALKWWKAQLRVWLNENWQFLDERRKDTEGSWWFVHKGARKAVRILVSASESSFTFLDHPTMPRTTNELEAQIGVLVQKHIIHRGLKQQRIPQFIKWFIYFYNRRLLS